MKVQITLSRCLNDLAWLLEQNASGCTAVWPFNNKLIIADNDLYASSKDNAVFRHCKNVIAYLISNPSTEKSKVLLKDILLAKCKTLYKGLVTVSMKPELLEKVIECYLNNQQITAEGIIFELKLKHHKDSIGIISQYLLKFERRLKRVKDYLKANPKSDLSMAINANSGIDIKYSKEQALNKITRDWLLDGKKSECGFLLTNSKGTHAELKIVDFIIAAQLIGKASIGKISPLGISKKCCIDCDNVIKLVNSAIKNNYNWKEAFFKVTDNHNFFFKKWETSLPVFLWNFADYIPKNSGILNLYRENKSIGFQFDEKTNKLSNIENIENLERKTGSNCSIWLHRDFKLIDEITNEYYETVFKARPTVKQAASPMSQSSPDIDQLKKSFNKPSQNSDISLLSTQMLIKELEVRATKTKNKRGLELVKEMYSVFDLVPKSEINKQVTGEFKGKSVIFDIFETKGDGNCGFYSLPIPYDKKAIINLMLANENNLALRHAIYIEIIEALKSDYLSRKLLEKFKEFIVFKEQEASFDLEQSNLIASSRMDLDRFGDLLANKGFEEITNHLRAIAHPVVYQAKLKKAFIEFSERKTLFHKEFEDFCKSKIVFAAFIKSYEDDSTRLAFAAAGASFNRENSLLDVILKLIRPPIKIYIWGQKSVGSTKISIIYEGGRAEGTETHIYHTPGLDTHFELMAVSDNSANLAPPNKKVKRQLFPKTLFFSASEEESSTNLETEDEKIDASVNESLKGRGFLKGS